MLKKLFGHFEYLNGRVVLDRTPTCLNITVGKFPIFKQEENKAKIITHILGFKFHTIKFRHFTSIPTKEVFYQHFNAEGFFSRFDLIVYLLAIEHEKGLNNFGWNLFTKMQTVLYGAERAEQEKTQLKEIIKGDKLELSLPTAPLVINREIKILGNIHQLALSLFYKEKNVVVEVKPKPNKKMQPQKLDKLFFVFNKFSKEELDQIEDRYLKVKEYLGPYRTRAFLWPPAIRFFDEITKGVSEFYKVISYKDIFFDEKSFKTFVKALYRCDDIADWKTDEKNKFMQDFFPKKVRILTLEIAHPIFRFKNEKMRFTVLDHITLLKTAFRENYKDKIENYELDIIMHSADNVNESEFMGDIVDSNFNLNGMLQNISQKGVVVFGIKSNVLEENLQDYPFCKDITIICKKELLQETISKTKDYLEKNLHNLFSFTFENGEDLCAFDIRYRNNVVYRFCIQSSYPGIEDSVLEKSITEATTWNNILVPNSTDEELYRKTLRKDS